jgi:hypothetical protein
MGSSSRTNDTRMARHNFAKVGLKIRLALASFILL